MKSKIRYFILDVLINGPASFLSLYGTSKDNFKDDFVGIQNFIIIIDGLLEDNLIEGAKLLYDGSFEELTDIVKKDAYEKYIKLIQANKNLNYANDEISLWYHITTYGKKVWGEWEGDR